MDDIGPELNRFARGAMPDDPGIESEASHRHVGGREALFEILTVPVSLMIAAVALVLTWALVQ